MSSKLYNIKDKIKTLMLIKTRNKARNLFLICKTRKDTHARDEVNKRVRSHMHAHTYSIQNWGVLCWKKNRKKINKIKQKGREVSLEIRERQDYQIF